MTIHGYGLAFTLDDFVHRLEELNERRQGHVQRVKIAEKEREALEGPRATAELYMAKDAEANSAKSSLYQIFIRQGRVSLFCGPFCGSNAMLVIIQVPPTLQNTTNVKGPT